MTRYFVNYKLNGKNQHSEYRQATRYNAPAIAKHMTTVCPNCGEEFEID